MGKFGVTILFGAFLLFQIQPQVAKTILPWFGGGAAVWSTCMLFFQVLLLGGYLYAHLLTRCATVRNQGLVHIVLLLVSFLFLPIAPSDTWKPHGNENPALYILGLLLANVGVPYLLLAATGPLLQTWFSRRQTGRSPYRLYALSNVGSLAALVSFPFVFEPNVSISLQSHIWAGLYVVFGACCLWCAWPDLRSKANPVDFVADTGAEPLALVGDDPVEPTPLPLPDTIQRDRAIGGLATLTAPIIAIKSATTATSPTTTEATAAIVAKPTMQDRALWVGLSALPSAFLLATTNTLCQDIAVVPFFWVMPLAIYLVTFILTFDSKRWYRPLPMAAVLLLLATSTFVAGGLETFVRSVLLPGIAFGALLFVCGMVCHGELVRRKPAAAHLTGFYLAISSGGALGGVFVALIAPAVFSTYVEVPLLLLCCAGVALWVTWRPAALRATAAIVITTAVVIGAWLRLHEAPEFLELSRNFHGRLSVRELVQPTMQDGGVTMLRTVGLSHGQTLHGQQVFGSPLFDAGMTYYGERTGVGYAMRQHPARGQRALRIGVIGLGAGTLARYAEPNDSYVFFEIDPDVVRLADKHFTYLADARRRGARIDVRIGDGRVQLERDTGQFDVLVVDAFHSDGIPTHLLTRECGSIYARHLATDGILMVHISNVHLDLEPVVRGLASAISHEIRILSRSAETPCQWALLTRSAGVLARPELALPANATTPRSLVWTDDFSSLWHILK